MFLYFFFFKQKTAYEIRPCDWSSDVCSSDLRIVDLDLRSLDARGAEVAELHLRINLEGRAELERLVVGGGFFLDARVAGDAQVGFLHDLGESLLHCVAEHFRAHLRPVSLRHQLERHLAGAESGHAHVARELLQPLIDLPVDFLDRNAHRYAPLERPQRLHVRRHSAASPVDPPAAMGAKGGTRTLKPRGAGT